MARKINIDNAKKDFAGRKNQENNKNRSIKIYFLIVCEGEKTEPNYFKSFPKKIGKYVYDLSFDSGGINTLGVVNKAIELRDNSVQQYDRVWAVFDRDSFPDNSFNNAIEKAKVNNICCAWSNESFELWYLLHFVYRNTPMSRTDYKTAIEAAINSKSKKKFIYKKNYPNMYSILESYGNQKQASKWADKLMSQYSNNKFAQHNPCTTVHKLVTELNGESKKLNSEVLKNFELGE